MKLFRRIRERLLMGNKAGKYLKYAVGEIALVVIGILIALQINNWNEHRKAEAIKQILLEELKQEFQENLLEIESHQKLNSKSNDYLIRVLNYSAGNDQDLSIDSLRKYSSNMFNIMSIAISKSSLDGIIASGNISLFDSELISLLTGFEASFNAFNNISKTTGQKFSSQSCNDFLLNFAYYQPYHNFVYPDKPLATHPAYIKSDEDFKQFIREPATYSTMNDLYILTLASTAWVNHLQNEVKNIITQIEANQLGE